MEKRKKCGLGTEICKDYTYEGRWYDGKWNGKGKLSLPSGETYKGVWKDGKPSGKMIWSEPDFRRKKA